MEGLGRPTGELSRAEQGREPNQGMVLALPCPTSSISNLMVCKDLSVPVS